MRSPPNVETSPQARFDVRGVWRRLEGTKAHPYGHAFAAAGVTGRAGGMVNDGNPTSITQETRVTTCASCSGGGWLQGWGGGGRGGGRGLQNTTNTCCDAFFMFWRWG